jgi:hypothetical protein
MSNRSPITFGARTPAFSGRISLAKFLILSLFLGALGNLNTGSTLAANNSGAEPQTAGAQDRSSQLSGQLIANGPVTVNGNKAITGTTVFTDSHIAVDCAKGNSAVINLGKLGRIDIVAGTKLTLRFSDGLISGDLQEGKAIISTPSTVKVSVNTPDGGVVTSNCTQVTQECVTPVTVQGSVQCVPVVAGAPAPAPIPVHHGLGGWAIAGIVGGAAAVTGGAIAASNEGSRRIVALPVSPVAP